MARPRKIALDYFPLDCQMNDKIEMLEAVCGLHGFAVYIKLLQEIYQTETGEFDMSGVFRWKTLCKKYGIPEDNLRGMVGVMTEINLFDKNEFENRQILTSDGVKKRLHKVEELRERERNRKQKPNSQPLPANDEFSAGKPAENDTKEKESKREIESEREKDSENPTKKQGDPSAADASAAPGQVDGKPKNKPALPRSPSLRKSPNEAPGGAADNADEKPASVVYRIKEMLEARTPGIPWGGKEWAAAKTVGANIRNSLSAKQRSDTDDDVLKALALMIDQSQQLREFYRFTSITQFNAQYANIYQALIDLQKNGKPVNQTASNRTLGDPAKSGRTDATDVNEFGPWRGNRFAAPQRAKDLTTDDAA